MSSTKIFEEDDPYREQRKPENESSAQGCLTCLNSLPGLQPNPIARTQAILYATAVVLSLAVCIPVGVQLRAFEGGCLLFAQLSYRVHPHHTYFLWPWMDTCCDYQLYMNLAVNFIFCILMVLLYVVLLLPRASERRLSAKIRRGFQRHLDNVLSAANPMMTVVHVTIWILQVASAGFLLIGFHVFFCDWFYKGMKARNPDYDLMCYEIDSKAPWDNMVMLFGEGKPVDGSTAFLSYTIAMVASWLLVLVWTGQLYLNFGQICTRCTCRRAEEKVKIDNKAVSAAARSRMMSPIGTPGGYSNLGANRGLSVSSQAFNSSFA